MTTLRTFRDCVAHFFRMPGNGHQRRTPEQAIHDQLELIVRQHPTSDDFQRGYLCALIWTWEQAGLQSTPITIAARAIIEATLGKEPV